MDVTVSEEPVSSYQGNRKDVALPLVATGSAVDPKVELASNCISKDEKLTGPLSECTSSTLESEDLSQRGQQEEEAAVVEKKDIRCGLDTDEKTKDDETRTVEQLGEKCKSNNEADFKSVHGDKEKGNRKKQLETGEDEHKMREREEKKVRKGKERKVMGISMSEIERKEAQKGADLEVEENDHRSKDGGLLSKVYGKEQELQKGKGRTNSETVAESKKEKKVKSGKKGTDNSGQTEREKKGKKSKIPSERIEKKLERINAKIGRILAKKDDYLFMLKEAQDNERQEAEKAGLQEREASTAVAGKSANAQSGSGLRREESAILDEFRSQHEAGRCEVGGDKPVERWYSGSLPRTESVVEVPAHLIEEAVGQKESVEDPPNVLKSDEE